MSARDIGLFAASGPTGPLNAIVDVPGVAVGHVTHIAGEGPAPRGVRGAQAEEPLTGPAAPR